ncbi:hypothetical protein BGZ60DRAFT_399572 [Tricladium varicosporioides]|nr:hypothetical protein BGZ60DRAFT_399572 [Hymenoscyphus varicosporioides]
MKFLLPTVLFAPLVVGSALLRKTVAPIRNIYTFGPGVFVENIAVRSNSQLLTTSMSVPQLYQIDPTVAVPTATAIYTFASNTGTSGIAEVLPDVFAVVTGIWDLANTRAVNNSINVWTVNLTGASPVVNNICNVVNTTIFNAISRIPGTPRLILAADSALGAVWRVDLLTGVYGVAFSSPLFTPVSSATGSNLGINGMQVKDGYLYFTNSAQGLFGKVAIDSQGNKVGDIQIISYSNATSTTGLVYDDFSFDLSGNAWIAAHPAQAVKVTPAGVQTVVTNTTLFKNPTSAARGRGTGQRTTMYVTNGGEFASDFTLFNEGVVAIDVPQFL